MKAFAVCIAWMVVSACSHAGDLLIDYSHAGLTRVEVTAQKKLYFGWHTGRCPFEKDDRSLSVQSLDGYDSHSANVWLTKEELAAFGKWIADSGILDLKSDYPEPEKKTYGSAFKSTLTVTSGDRKHSIAWTGDTKVPDALPAAVKTLVQMCHDIRKSREGQ